MNAYEEMILCFGAHGGDLFRKDLVGFAVKLVGEFQNLRNKYIDCDPDIVGRIFVKDVEFQRQDAYGCISGKFQDLFQALFRECVVMIEIQSQIFRAHDWIGAV